MKRIFLSLILLLSHGFTFALVDLHIDSTKIRLGEAFNLTLTIEGSSGTPDLTPLQQDFTIVGTERNMNYSLVNGQTSAVTQWTILLMPQRAGVLTIPPIRVGNEQTSAATIEVTGVGGNTDSTTDEPQQDVTLSTQVNQAHPYVNEQIIYTIRLYYGRKLLDSNYQGPQVDNGLLVPLGEGRRYQTNEKGRTYLVEEQQYAVFPQKSGDLTITPPQFTALVYDIAPRRVKTDAKPTVLKVRPMPPQYKGKEWLPAKQVTLTQTYDKPSHPFKQGDTLIRRVTLTAVAVPAQLLPVPDFVSTNQFSVYPEKLTETSALRDEDLVGTTSFKVTYLLNDSGKVTIPAVKLPWFNTVSGKEEQALLPPLTIDVGAGVIPQAKQTSGMLTDKQKSLATSSPEGINLNPSDRGVAWWLAGGFAAAWIITLGLWYWQRRKKLLHPDSSQAFKTLKEACLQNDATQAQEVLIQWANLRWPDGNFLNLSDVAKWLRDPQLKKQITLLSQVLYNPAAQKNWQGDALWRSVAAYKSVTKSVKKNKSYSLPPIHPL